MAKVDSKTNLEPPAGPVHSRSNSNPLSNGESATDSTEAKLEKYMENWYDCKTEAWKRMKSYREIIKDAMTELGGSVYDILEWKNVVLTLIKRRNSEAKKQYEQSSNSANLQPTSSSKSTTTPGATSSVPASEFAVDELPLNCIRDLILLCSKMYRRNSNLYAYLTDFFELIFGDGTDDLNFHFCEMREINLEIDRLRKELSEFKEKCSSLETELHEIRPKFEEATTKLQRLEKENSFLYKRTSIVQEQFATMGVSLLVPTNNQSVSIESMKAQMLSLDKFLQQTYDTVQSYASEINTIQPVVPDVPSVLPRVSPNRRSTRNLQNINMEAEARKQSVSAALEVNLSIARQDLQEIVNILDRQSGVILPTTSSTSGTTSNKKSSALSARGRQNDPDAESEKQQAKKERLMDVLKRRLVDCLLLLAPTTPLSTYFIDSPLSENTINRRRAAMTVPSTRQNVSEQAEEEPTAPENGSTTQDGDEEEEKEQAHTPDNIGELIYNTLKGELDFYIRAVMFIQDEDAARLKAIAEAKALEDRKQRKKKERSNTSRRSPTKSRAKPDESDGEESEEEFPLPPRRRASQLSYQQRQDKSGRNSQITSRDSFNSTPSAVLLAESSSPTKRRPSIDDETSQWGQGSPALSKIKRKNKTSSRTKNNSNSNSNSHRNSYNSNNTSSSNTSNNKNNNSNNNNNNNDNNDDDYDDSDNDNIITTAATNDSNNDTNTSSNNNNDSDSITTVTTARNSNNTNNNDNDNDNDSNNNAPPSVPSIPLEHFKKLENEYHEKLLEMQHTFDTKLREMERKLAEAQAAQRQQHLNYKEAIERLSRALPPVAEQTTAELPPSSMTPPAPVYASSNCNPGDITSRQWDERKVQFVLQRSEANAAAVLDRLKASKSEGSGYATDLYGTVPPAMMSPAYKMAPPSTAPSGGSSRWRMAQQEYAVRGGGRSEPAMSPRYQRGAYILPRLYNVSSQSISPPREAGSRGSSPPKNPFRDTPKIVSSSLARLEGNATMSVHNLYEELTAPSTPSEGDDANFDYDEDEEDLKDE